MRGQFWCRFQFGVDRNLWVMGGYGILGVWVKKGLTVVPKLWVFPERGYGLLVIEDLRVMVCKSPPTELVDQKIYGISGFMGYQSHGL